MDGDEGRAGEIMSSPSCPRFHVGRGAVPAVLAAAGRKGCQGRVAFLSISRLQCLECFSLVGSAAKPAWAELLLSSAHTAHEELNLPAGSGALF